MNQDTPVSLAKFIYDQLLETGLPELILDEEKQRIKIPNGEILNLKNKEYSLVFYWYSEQDAKYSKRDKYSEITFPQDFDIRHFLIFKRSGSYKLKNEQIFRDILNPLSKETRKIKVSNEYKILRFYKKTLILPTETFASAMREASLISKKGNSYRKSTEHYLSNLRSRDYSKNVRKQTTYLEKGEFNFLIDRLYLNSKKGKKDFLRFLGNEDITSIEELITQLLRYEVLSEDFMRMLNDYFIREKLKDIIILGKSILDLNSTNLQTVVAKEIITKLGLTNVSQLETLWQKYFEKNLLYLIFTYKKVFPKIELKDVEGDKKYPDFIGINHYNGLDIIEIKTHLKNALVWDSSHQNFYFSPELSKAIVQTTNYMDAVMQERFKVQEDREKITKFTEEENLFHPRGIIVISSNKKLTTKVGESEKLKRDFTKLRNSLQNIEILTFDEIINIADEYIKNIIPDTKPI